MIDYKVKDKIALITGGSHGIGLEIAMQLASQGARIAICSRTEERLKSAEKVFKKINADYLIVQADALNPIECKNVVKVVSKKWKKIDILINNVGGGGSWGNEDILKTDFSVWRDVIEKNLFSASLFTNDVLPSMIKNKWGRIITITSIIGKESLPGSRPWFNIAKAGQAALMKSLSKNKKYVRKGITFNSIAPGGILIPDTGFDDMKKNHPREYKSMIDIDYPLGRQGTPEEVANLVLFLCSELSDLINGSQFVIDGGQSNSY